MCATFKRVVNIFLHLHLTVNLPFEHFYVKKQHDYSLR